MIAILDGDVIAYRAAAGAAKTFDWGDGQKSTAADPEEAAQAALNCVEVWRSLAGCRKAIVAFSGDHNFRKRLLPTYKQGRPGKPPNYRQTVEAIADAYPVRIVHGLEGDDVMGIMATSPKYVGRAVLVSIDKDLKFTIPGLHLNPGKDEKPVEINEAQADHGWLLQTLMGDSTDGYKGIPKVGPKKASAILGPPGVTPLDRLWSRVVAAYAAAKLTAAEALVQARVARILRASDYDKQKKELLLWHPTEPTRLALSTVTTSSGPLTTPGSPSSP